MGQNPVRFIQITDTHFFSGKNGELLGVPTQKSFNAVMDVVEEYVKQNPIDFILHTGDLSQDNSRDSYEMLAARLREFRVPIYAVPGNHDDIALMNSVLPHEGVSDCKVIQLKDWMMILLNSQKPLSVEGYLDVEEFKIMERALQTYPDKHAIIAFHHQPIPVGAEWLDNLYLQNSDEFWDKLKQYPKVHTILFGHVHQVFEKVVHGIRCYSAPSTCFQFKCCQSHFGIENIPPGCRWIALHENGFLETGILRAPGYVGYFDASAKGY